MNDKAYIDEEFESLIPIFMSNQKSLLEEILSCLDLEDFDKIMYYGHRIIGTGENYGFLEIGKFGRDLEEASKVKDKNMVKKICDMIFDYMESVEIIYIEV